MVSSNYKHLQDKTYLWVHRQLVFLLTAIYMLSFMSQCFYTCVMIFHGCCCNNVGWSRSIWNIKKSFGMVLVMPLFFCAVFLVLAVCYTCHVFQCVLLKYSKIPLIQLAWAWICAKLSSILHCQTLRTLT